MKLLNAIQYKGKNSFAHLSQSDIKTCRKYFITSHGKFQCDVLGAVVNSACFRVVTAKKKKKKKKRKKNSPQTLDLG